MFELRDPLLDTCLTRVKNRGGDTDAPNNRLDLHRLDRAPSLRLRVATQIKRLVAAHNPDLLVPVPGADWLATDVAEMRRIAKVILRRDPETSELGYRPYGQEIRQAAKSIVVVDDTLNDLSGVQNVLDVIGTDDVKAVVGVWDRDPEAHSDLGGIAVSSLISEYIPPQVTKDSPFWAHLPSEY
jgi:hypothetical protein